MRYSLLTLLLLLCGCGSKTPTAQVTDSTGSNQLALFYQRVWSLSDILQPGTSGHDFEALVWRRKDGIRWKNHVEISKNAFQAGSLRRRWVSEIHSLDGANGIAILKVAEGNAPEGVGAVSYIYSWREWNLATNGEVRLLRICTNVFERF